MHNIRRQFIQAALAPVAASALTPWSAFAQNALPLEVVKIVNGFPAGGSADVTSRRVGDKMGGTNYTKSAVVENKTGAAGRIAVDTVKAANPDGATLLLTPYSMMSIYPHIYSKLSYDPLQRLCDGGHGVHVVARTSSWAHGSCHSQNRQRLLSLG